MARLISKAEFGSQGIANPLMCKLMIVFRDELLAWGLRPVYASPETIKWPKWPVYGSQTTKHIEINKMVGPAGLEPATYRL